MKKLAIFAILMLTGMGTIDAQPAEEKELIQLEHDWMVAAKNKDAAFHEALLAPEYSFTAARGILYDRKAAIARSVDPGNSMNNETLMDVKVHQFGDLWMVTFDSNYLWTENGVTDKADVRSLDVFIKRDGRWQCLYSQNTARWSPATP